MVLTSCKPIKFSSSSTFSSSSSSSFISSSTSSTFLVPSIKDIDGTPQMLDYLHNGYTPCLKDPNFKNGFIVSKSSFRDENPHYDKKLNIYNEYKDNDADWSIAQWATRHDLYDENNPYTDDIDFYGLRHTIKSSGSYTTSGSYLPAKVIQVNSYTGEIYIESNCEVEYESPRKGGDPWVHLLLATGLGPNKYTHLSQLSSFVVDLDYTVNYCDNKMETGTYDKSIHCGQFNLYFSFQNRIPGHEDYGKYVWFGFELYDNRSGGTKTSLAYFHDKDTGSLIYKLGSIETIKGTDGYIPVVNQRARLQCDIIQYCKDSLAKATELGYFKSSTFEDMFISGFNVGFEVTGTFNIGTTIHAMNFYSK